ncbi:unnamed protein product [Klebsiella pneumoniae subsp. rhinoscleromatis SB3432]|nr:unnamed protein product [Klebsiella pneumoniae subsp. rhinoscleromatis SB3432]
MRFSGPKTSIICSPMTSLKTSIKTITYLSDIGCLEIQGASLDTDVTISIDADLQDDVNCIEKMIDAYSQGYDIVYGVRCNRDSDTFFKRTTANAFYAIMSHMGVNQTPNHADYRLLSNRALEALKQYKE